MAKNYAVLSGVAGQPVAWGKVYDVLGANVIIEDFSGNFGDKGVKSPPWDIEYARFFNTELEAEAEFKPCKRTEGG